MRKIHGLFADCSKKCAWLMARRKHGADPNFATAGLIRGLRTYSRKPIEIHGTAATIIVPITSASR